VTALVGIASAAALGSVLATGAALTAWSIGGVAADVVWAVRRAMRWWRQMGR
jgi:hypothetical protein